MEMTLSLAAGIAAVAWSTDVAKAQIQVEPVVSLGIVRVGTGQGSSHFQPYTVSTSFDRGVTLGGGFALRTSPSFDLRFEGLLSPSVGTTPAYSSCLYGATCVNLPRPLPPPPHSSTTFGRLALGLGFRPNLARHRIRLGAGVAWAKASGPALNGARSSEVGGYASVETITFRWGHRFVALGIQYTSLLDSVHDADSFLEPRISLRF